ncbi:hypothetical protein CU097_010728 [Rhizopus azygosporus]|uniref:Uncharacterized protein n=1 Tax=Rhizopus azygosporus TaxID=86630 RepID=A0A367K4D5_RHIAZ|nr:hypothetical protein CU097_010728 [Rhizopus azygosporus]
MNLAYFLVCKSLEPEEAEDYVLKSITTAQFWNHMHKRASSTPTGEARYVVYKRLMKRIVDYMPLSGAEQQEFFGNNQEIINFYKYQHGNYFEYFYPMKEEKLTGTDTASVHSEIYLTYFKSLLTDINNYAKRLSLLPIASHQIVHVSIPSDTFYHLLKRAYTENYNVPDSVTKPQESLLKNNV